MEANLLAVAEELVLLLTSLDGGTAELRIVDVSTDRKPRRERGEEQRTSALRTGRTSLFPSLTWGMMIDSSRYIVVLVYLFSIVESDLF